MMMKPFSVDSAGIVEAPGMVVEAVGSVVRAAAKESVALRSPEASEVRVVARRVG